MSVDSTSIPEMFMLLPLTITTGSQSGSVVAPIPTVVSSFFATIGITISFDSTLEVASGECKRSTAV